MEAILFKIQTSCLIVIGTAKLIVKAKARLINITFALVVLLDP